MICINNSCKNVSTRKDYFCSTSCFNKVNKIRDIDGWRKCKMCLIQFPFRKTSKTRQTYSVKLGMKVGSMKQKFCSFPCAMKYRNTYDNPAQNPTYVRKISTAAKIRGTQHMQTESVRAKQASSITGIKHWNWQGGITKENKRLRNQKEYRDWRKSVFERDGYKCVLCGAMNGNGKTVKINADHIKPWSLYPNDRYDINNGRTLCVPCHKNTDTYMGRIKRFKQLHNEPLNV